MVVPLDKVLTVRDAVTGAPSWRLTRVDDAGRYRTEVLGTGTTTERTYFDAKQRVKTITTESAATTVQSLAYDYDARLDLVSRTDVLQPQHPTERFRYDALERLTCAYFSPSADPAAPCHTSYTYAPDGNLTSKSEFGALAYNDPAHPHAVTEAGGDSFGDDAAGNQNARPGGVTVTYTAFDLPRTVTQGGGTTVSFGYDGDERRVRKTTPAEETLSFGDLYERVTDASAEVVHRYHIFSPERVIAIVTRGGDAPGTLYLHADHLGSVDAVTGEAGSVEERRSYDAFGQRRNPVWGDPPPAVFAPTTSFGFTGHESDAELGLVNMKGRLFDPRIGRFLTTDPLIADVTFGQSLNPYTYVFNNPLNYVDPSGFLGEPDKPPILPIRVVEQTNEDGSMDVLLIYPPRVRPPNDGVPQLLAIVPSNDMDTTGANVPQRRPTRPRRPRAGRRTPTSRSRAVSSRASRWDSCRSAARPTRCSTRRR